MNLTIVLDGLQQDLQGLGELGDERSARVAQRLGDALSSNLRLKLFDLLGQAALELSSKLPSGHVEVRLAGQEPEFVFVDETGESSVAAGEELTARVSEVDFDAVLDKLLTQSPEEENPHFYCRKCAEYHLKTHPHHNSAPA